MSSKSKLTPRESEIVDCLLRGSSNQMIASDLDVSTNTVKTHLKNIYIKMSVATRQELIIKLLK